MGIKQKSKSLLSQQNPLSNTFIQLEVLQGQALQTAHFQPFVEILKQNNQLPLQPISIDVLQVNITKQCNQSCAHCHVDASPERREMISKAHLDKILNLIDNFSIKTVDITGGAPELHPLFRYFVEELSKRKVIIMNRCNLTIIVSNPKFYDLPQFFKTHKVQIVSSLPFYNAGRTDSQRGEGVFEDSIKALKMLNEVGYGVENAGLLLDLVYNPSGAFLPAAQLSLENEFKKQLYRKYNIVFNHLFAITNMPISRFLDYLLQSGNYAEYMESLVSNFNPLAVQNVMCRNMISVSWDGFIYDCDFNQMLDLKVNSNNNHLDNFDFNNLLNRNIVINQHCYGCTAGAGSSCGGEVSIK
jgi:radical SAM/Cys-rich protein